jgi:arabinose-5-phosphate isomerase
MNGMPDLVETGRRVLAAEAAALQTLAEQLGPEFESACQLLIDCTGRVIITGMGKSGIIAQKIAASFTSTGRAAHFLHPAEGVHGDLGVVHKQDLLLAISNSGETPEILELLAPIRALGVPIIAITQNPHSGLGYGADVVLSLGQLAEADRHNLIPSTSTTLTLALGDALTIAVMEARGFTERDFAVLHPQGMLGKRLTLKVKSLLRGDETNPVVRESDTLTEALDVITLHTLGGTCVADADGKLCGIITDGDVRRIFRRLGSDGVMVSEALQTPVSKLMTPRPIVITTNHLAYEALQLMENHKPRPISLMPVVDECNCPVGMLHLHALVQAGFKSSRRSPEDEIDEEH